MIEPVVDPAIMAIRVDILSLATAHVKFEKSKHGPPASSKCSLKIKSACSSIPTNSVIEPVVDPAIMAIRVDILSWATKHDGSAKPKHGSPASSQHSLINGRRFAAVIATWNT